MGDAGRRVTFLAYRGLGTALQWAPDALGDAAAAVVVEVMARRQKGPKELALRHMRRVLSSGSPVPPDEALVARWSRRSFRNYARYWVEGARLPRTAPGAVMAAMTMEHGYEHLKAAMAAGRGVVMALPHVGSWEWGGAYLAIDGYPMTSVAERLEPPELFEWFIDQRQAMGLRIVALGPDSGPAILRTLRAGGLVGLLCDRDLVGNGVEVEFFGETTTFPAGPATMALRTGAALVTGAVYTGPNAHHFGVISAPLDTARSGSFRADVARLTQEIAHRFESAVRRAPEQWHLFQPNWPSDDPAGTLLPEADGRTGPGPPG